MSKFLCPKGYESKLSLYDTQRAIGLLKREFEDDLSKALCLTRVSAPLFVSVVVSLSPMGAVDAHPVKRSARIPVKMRLCRDFIVVLLSVLQ